MSDPLITRLEIHQYTSFLPDIGRDYNGFNLVYEPGGKATLVGFVLRVFTDVGVIGEYNGGTALDYAAFPMFAPYLFGKNALERERIYTDVNRALRQVARLGYAPVDIALWDIAGKIHDRRSTGSWVGTRTACRATPAPITATTSRTACPARTPSRTSPSSASSWATRHSRSTAGGGRRSARRSPTSTRSGKRVGAQDGPDDRPGLRVHDVRGGAQGRLGVR